ncbi:MAG: DNA primase [Lysobacteraceae bacterium SCN 69-123]|uniref:DNA primase n=1 Tax=Stenotrophomonas acidaminiphila TaxID=128780 RepID=UPI00086E84B3|nr:DNA primase [Stenotrophomonas acidaminiphila]MBN8802568.1 DNA primase [Stenotrophomonas acidaminiphila]MDF9443249.1 DNA primase [Stenotrophomonas acidaminiphila]ODU41010.1 MAG: DNA primase [Xanthomonadaceae bacterium SCN 69-123]OJY73478.1 MAG: DNA primase [Stenotrophomonas sp. 69-14]
MARIPDAFIDDLLARSDIVEVVGSRVPLKRQGKEYAARCPFHDERSASFTVSPTKQFYHCFGCGAHGTAISFLMNYDRLEFLDAVEELAKRAGMEVPRDANPRSPQQQDDSRDQYSALDAAARFFQKQLEGSDKALAYLDGRGVDADTRARFSIGYAPDGYSALKDALGKDERRMKLLDRVGLFSKNDRGHVYDKFRDRVMFPIFDRRGRVIAFGGRVMQKDDGPKYLNSPETALFHKGRELYGLWQVRQANQKIERLIVVEGYMDVVSLFQFGVTQAVATLGTATTPDHAELLFRNAPDVYFCFDGDAAGRRAAWRALESVLPRMKDGRQAFFLFLPDGEDPDTIVRKEGAEAFDARLKQATPLSQFFFDELTREINLGTLDGKARLAERARPMLAQIPDGAFGDLMKQELQRLTGIGRAAAGSAQTTAPMRRAAVPPVQKRSLVRAAIAILLQQPSLALSLEGHHAIAGLRLAGIELLLELLELVQQRPDISTGALLEHFDGREEQTALHRLAAVALPGDEASWTQELHDAIVQLEKQLLQQRLDELQAKQRQQGLDETDKFELRELLKARATMR